MRTSRIVLRGGPHDGWECELPWDEISGLEFDNMLPPSISGVDGTKLRYRRRGVVERREDGSTVAPFFFDKA
ncbi:MAG: hypothetical protein AAGA99_26540 [Actinomycetota bacterium]